MIDKFIYKIKELIKQPFKIGIVSYYYPIGKSGNNGVALHSYYLSRELAKKGYDIHIFTKTDKKFTREEYLGKGRIIIHGIETVVDSKISDPVANKRMNYFIYDHRVIDEISKENKKSSFDVIHTHGWLTAGAFIAKHLNRVPWVHTFHALEKNRIKFMTPEEKKYFQIARWMESTINHADAVISVSEHLRKESMEEYEIKDRRTFVIPNGVDHKIFFRDKNIEKKKQVLYVGRFSLEKGVDLIPGIAQNVLDSNPNVKFIVVASNSHTPESLKNISKQFEYLEETYKERFKWIREPISSTELAKLYNESIIYMQPSRYEAFGMTILEAMACGCCVITSNKGGIPEVVSDAGEVIPLNTALFSRKIKVLLENYRLREKYSKKAIEQAEKFGWEEISERVLGIYDSVGKNSSKSRDQKKEEMGDMITELEKISGLDKKQ